MTVDLRQRARRALGRIDRRAPVACLHLSLADARACPTCGPTVAEEIRRSAGPRLAVWKGAGRWRWYVVDHPSPRYSDRTNDDGHATWREALAVGLAAMEAAQLAATGRHPLQ